MRPKKIELHIDELILDDSLQGDKYSIGQAVEQELSRLLAEHGVPQSLAGRGNIDHIDGGTIETPSSGAQVARAVFRGLSK